MDESRRGDFPTCFASCSIGFDHARYTLPDKLVAIANAGFDAIELSMSDILGYGQQISESKLEIDPKDYATLRSVGKDIGDLCQKQGLEILILQPFANFEGWPKGTPQREDAFERAMGWMGIMEAVGTDMLQIGSSDAEGILSSLDDSASDLAELADTFAEKGFKIAYENWSWATHASTWKNVWEIVKRANRPNLGLCLDTFQSAGGEWGNPTTESGLNEGANKDELERRWRASCEELSKTVPSDKIFFLQISDAYKMDPPLKDEPDENGLRPRGQWSHDCRPLPYDGGYLPIENFTRAVLKTDFRGWMSMEVFDGRGPEKYGDDMGIFANQAFHVLQKLLNRAGESE
ncbi:uncharacterized protein Z518_02820 [Rhinocladiella mackenziei CBS 650.93]|uniref:Xylose isomerase-like TIM barrel domain-containing protein n=1 Tax=Rhinocladiella mackenziei CBS 650.93 TaxID=1442369 RepID=A0A0D2IQF7_9EURO|nr:uncharacterized protein Z518_02820 [Rhinocladiella mackenziei CBS 650.93]KIX08164.1 hypothetical protein Z518_02820 [Rhinocladiella mackenziei CBS 650.93]